VKWQIEDIGIHCNILEDKPGINKDDQKPIGIGYPSNVAANIVKQHNESLLTDRQRALIYSGLSAFKNTNPCLANGVSKELNDIIKLFEE